MRKMIKLVPVVVVTVIASLMVGEDVPGSRLKLVRISFSTTLMLLTYVPLLQLIVGL